MVSALFRHDFPFEIRSGHLKKEADNIIAVNQSAYGINAFPYALKEFINSISDLPTIEELAKTSNSLAQALGIAG